MESFVCNISPCHVIFGPGSSSKLPEQLAQRKLHAALVLSTPRQLDKATMIEQVLGSDAIGVFSQAKMHTPIEITQEALQVAQDLKADSIVSVGGGSTIGLGKAISIRTGLPHFCVPTTYAGSEMTPILGETVDGLKTTRRDPKILPDVVIYDVDLTATLPQGLSVTSGINAIAHAVEALYAPETNPIIRMLAKEGIKALSEALTVIVTSAQDMEARSKALYGAWLCGVCLGNTSMSLHHKLCHTLGGSFNLPHSETHTILLPHTFAYNRPVVATVGHDLADSLPDSDGDPVKGLNLLLERLGVHMALKDFGMKESDIDRAVSIVVANPYGNPRPIEERPIRELIQRAWAGERARADL
ncbi:putative maleylacetate reductase [Paramyrothecium foliicola]|nr:putative maleylacetate reductase [Paramyrothecium foliicola]